MALVAIGTALAALCPSASLAGDIAVSVSGDDFTVNGNCTLREAVQAANTNAAVDACPDPGGLSSADTVILDSDTYVIGIPPDGTPNDNLDGDFDIDTGMAAGDLTIQGEGRLVTEIDAEDVDRVLHLSSGGGTLTVDAASVRNGQVDGSAFADRGGGIFAQAGALTLVSAEVTSNETNAEGGGVAVAFPGSMTWSDTIISSNRSHGGTGGGGIHWSPGAAVHTLTLQGTSVIDNEAETAVAATQMFGGGISSFGKLTVNSGVISGNYALGTGDTRGGGVFHNGPSGAATFRGTVISGNSARNSAGATTNGGGSHSRTKRPGTASRSNSSTARSRQLSRQHRGRDAAGRRRMGAEPEQDAGWSTARSAATWRSTPAATAAASRRLGSSSTCTTRRSPRTRPPTRPMPSTSAPPRPTRCEIRSSPRAPAPAARAFFTSAGGNVDAGSSCWGVSAADDVQGAPAELGPLAQNGGTLVVHPRAWPRPVPRATAFRWPTAWMTSTHR